MLADNKKEKVGQFLKQLKGIANSAICRGNCEKAMAAISAGSYIQYQYNQVYTDIEFENMITALSDKMQKRYSDRLERMKKQENRILFYDGFGLDTRGVAIMYLNALALNGYEIVYVTSSDAKENQPELHQKLKNAVIEWKYVSMKKSYRSWVNELMQIITASSPKTMFFYTKPNDVAGAVSFCMCKGKCDRFLIDLTDHAFWLGTHSNDFFLGSREMSASNQFFKRGLPKEKLIKLGVNLIVNEEAEHEGLPFDVEQESYIFSGGSLYKTLGDAQNTFYKIADHILAKHPKIKFLYAGQGDATQFKILLEKYPERAFLIDERKDFYYLIKNCTLYLNTYPMFGGMMMKYSAYAGKIPITLKHDADSDGLLLNQEKAQIEYDSYDALIEDVDKLLWDPAYRTSRETLLAGTVITEARFVKNIRSAIEDHYTDYQHEITEIDTSAFQREFWERFDLKKEKAEIVDFLNRSLYVNMPWMYGIALKKLFIKVLRK